MTLQPGQRVLIHARQSTTHNGRTATIVGRELHGKRGHIEYWRVSQIEDLHPRSSHLFKASELEPIAQFI